MSNKYLFITLILVFFFLGESLGQCTIDATIESNPTSTILTINGNPKQSFVPCISGDISSLSFQVANATQSSTGTLSIVQGEGVGTVVASIPYGDITFTDTGYTTVDLSGISVPVDAGRIYSISFSIISNLRYHRFDDVYPDGGRFVGSTRVSDNDIVFELTIDSPTDYYVNETTGSDANDGSDFSNAFATIQKAIDTSTPGSNIYVAAGTYLPTAGIDFDESGGIDARELTFDIPSGYTLYGGFAGTETTIDLSSRDLVANETILSGNLGVAGSADNAYHVVHTKNVSENTLLNGFTIEEGNADGGHSSGLNTGAGWYNDGSDSDDSSPRAVSVIFQNNEAASEGGGFYNNGSTGTANPTFENCVFYNNDAGTGNGGAFRNVALSDPIQTDPTFINCTFYKNTCGLSGAAIASNGSGGGDFVNFTITNSIFFDNVATSPQFSTFNTIYLSASDADVSYTIFDDSSLPSGITDLGNNQTETDPLFEMEDDVVLSNCSPAANAGDNGAVTEAIDVQGNTRTQNTTVDIGAYELTNPEQPEIALNQSSIDFGSGSENQTLQETVTISNNGGFGDLDLTISIEGSDAYSLSSVPTSVAEGGSEDLVIDYAPSGIYKQIAEVLIISNDCENDSLTIQLSGDGVTPSNYSLAYGEPFVLGTREFSLSTSYILPGGSTSVFGLSVSNDGNKAFVLTAGAVRQFSMSTPFDISTASEDGSFSIADRTTSAQGMAFDAIGGRLFIVGPTDVFQYSLNNAFDLQGTVNYMGSFDISSDVSLPKGITFDSHGDDMMILDNFDDKVYSFTLTSPFDVVNGAVNLGFIRPVSANFSVPEDLQLSGDGEGLFVVEDEKLIRYAINEISGSLYFNDVVDDELSQSTSILADAKAIYYTPDARFLYIITRSISGLVFIRREAFMNESFDEPTINDGSVSGEVKLFLTGDTFVNTGSTLISGTHYNVNNLPSELSPQVTVNGDGSQVTFTITGTTEDHQTSDDVTDLSITFSDAAFTTTDSASVSILGRNAFNLVFRDNDITWDGSFDTDWSDARNWSSGRVPNVNENVIIPSPSSSSNRSPTIDQDVEINNLELSSGLSTVTLLEGKSLAIYGTASGNGSLVTSRAVVGDKGYSVIGATVTDQSVNDLTPTADFIYGYDGLSNVYSIPTQLDEGAGYFVAFDQSSPSISLSGKPVSGDVTRTVIFTVNGQSDDFELVANPYNAAISRQSFVDENGPLGTGAIDGTIYLWQDGGANLPNGTRAGSFLTINASGTATGGTFDGYIRSGQGFFVAANSTIESTLTFTPSMQTLDTDANTSDGFYRKSNHKMAISISGQDQQDELLLEFMEGATAQMDVGYDALKFMNSGLSIYSMMDESALAIQALPLEEESVIIPVGVYTSVAGEYVVSVSELALFSSKELYLLDLFTNDKYHLSEDTQIRVTLAEGKENSRFILLSEPMNVLGLNEELNGLSIQRYQHGIQIVYESNRLFEQVTIYTLKGEKIVDQKLDFQSGNAFINHPLKEDQVYILNIRDTSIKFILD